MISTTSPCTSVCQMHEPTGLCKGCWRTIDEIMAWGNASDAVKRLVWMQIAQRRASVILDNPAKS